MAAEKRSISAPTELFALAEKRRSELKYPSLSAYIKFLMEQDIEESKPHVRVSSKKRFSSKKRDPGKIAAQIHDLVRKQLGP